MGTSKSYSSSVKGQPQWGNLSNAITRACGSTATSKTLGNIVAKYVTAMGGSSNAGRGRSNISGRAAVRTAKKLGGFLATFSASGGNIEATLAEIGIVNLNGKTLRRVIDELIEIFSGAAATLDDISAKAAAEKILEELRGDANTIEEFGANLQEILSREGLEDIMIRFFGVYILERLGRMFYEKLVTEKGKTDCDNLFVDIRGYINEKLTNMNKTNPLDSIDWKSEKADRLIKNIQEDVLKVFEAYES